MVKLFFYAVIFFHLSLGASQDVYASEQSGSDALMGKIKSFLDEKTFRQNREFINVIFEPQSDFYKNDRVNTLKVVQTLKENGLLKLIFDAPREFQLNFKTSGSPLFFVKIMSDTLRSIGYYRYVTIASHLNASEFSWSINVKSEYATDPLILQNELQKNGCKIVDIKKESSQEWTYNIDMRGAHLNVEQLQSREKVQLKRSLYSHWMDVSQIEELEIRSSSRNQWYPNIAIYDHSLHLLKIIKENEIYKYMNLEMPKNAKYIKISDLYSLKNVKDELVLIPKGSR